MISRGDIQEVAEEQLLKLFPAMQDHLHRNLVPTQFKRPAAMTAITEETMRFRTNTTVARSATLVITLFCPADEYHNSDVNVMSAMTDIVMEHFSAPALPIGDRALDIGTVRCNVNLDYAEVMISLEWDDDRKAPADAQELMKDVYLAITVAGGKE